MLQNNLMLNLKLFFNLCVIIPFMEEIMFRYALKNFLIGYEYGDIINYCTFGFLHAINHIGQKTQKMVILYHILFATYVGYYLLQFDSILYTFPIHMIINLTVFGVTRYIHYKNTKMQKYKCENKNIIIHNFMSDSFFVSSKTQDDAKISYFRNTHDGEKNNNITDNVKWIQSYTLPKDLRKSFDNYNSIEKKHKKHW